MINRGAIITTDPEVEETLPKARSGLTSYVPIAHVRSVEIEQARLGMQKLLEVLGRTWGPERLRMVFAAGAGRPYQGGFAVKADAGGDALTSARDLIDIASVLAPWLGFGVPLWAAPWEPLGPVSHELRRGDPVDAPEVQSSAALAWPVCSRDEHRWALVVDIGELLDGSSGSPAQPGLAGERGVRCTVTLHGEGRRRDLVANLLAQDTLGAVSLVADPVRPSRPPRATVLPVQFVGHLLATPARVPGAFAARPALSCASLISLIATTPSPHLLIAGGSGQGKSTLMGNLIDHAARSGEPVVVVDVHDGLLTDTALDRCLEHGQDPEFADFSADVPPTLHLTQPSPGVDAAVWAAELYGIVRTLLWADMPAEYFGPVLERTLRALLEVLIRDPAGAHPLHELPRLLDPEQEVWRSGILERIGDTDLARTIVSEIMPMVTQREAGNTLVWITGKLEPLIGDPYLRGVTSGTHDTTGLEDAVTQGRPFLVHAPASLLGDQGSRVVIATLLHRMWLAVRRRSHPSTLHVLLDEWQRYPVPSLAIMLAEGRKFGVRLRLANQNLSQLAPNLRDSVLGNAGAVVCFRVGPADAAYLDGYFPTVTQRQLQTLPRHHFALTTGDSDLITVSPPPLV